MFAVDLSPVVVPSLSQATPAQKLIVPGIEPVAFQGIARNALFRVGIILLTAMACVVNVRATVSLAWDGNPEPDIAGYRIYYGTISRVYSAVIDVGSSTTATFTNLNKDTVYFIAVTAYNSAGIESPYSEELAFETPPNQTPTVAIITPVTGSAINVPSMINAAAHAADSDGLIAKVEFYVDSTKVGESSKAPFATSWQETLVGDHTLSVIAYDDSGATSTATSLLRVFELAVNSTRHLPDGSFELKVSGAPGRINRVLASTDLQTWTELESVVNVSGSVSIIDSEAAQHSRRFYKVVSD